MKTEKEIRMKHLTKEESKELKAINKLLEEENKKLKKILKDILDKINEGLYNRTF